MTCAEPACIRAAQAYNLVFSLVFFIQAEPYIGITPGCAASESGVTSVVCIRFSPTSK